MTNMQASRVVVVGASWAGLGATDHLVTQGYEVTLLEAGAYPGELVTGWQTAQGQAVEAGIHGFWYPYAHSSVASRRATLSAPVLVAVKG